MWLARITSIAILCCCWSALAQQSARHHLRYGPGVCGPADPTYIRTAEETGGQPLFLAPDEIGKAFDLVRESTRENHVTLLWARGELSGGHDFVVPVDSTVQRLVFSLSYETAGGKLAVLAPGGREIDSTTPAAKVNELNCGRIVMIAPPAPGKWRARVSGKGRFWLEASGTSEIFLIKAEFVKIGGRPGHQGYFRIPGQPVAGEPASLQAELNGKTQEVQFHLISPEAEILQTISMQTASTDVDEAEFLGEGINLPAKPFRLAVTGTDESGHRFQRVFPSLFHAESVEVIPLEPGLHEVPAGQTTVIRFRVRNPGPARDFRILAVDSKNYLHRSPPMLSLAAGESKEVQFEMSVPAAARNYDADTVVVTVTATTGPATSNSAVTELTIGTPAAQEP